MERTIGNLGQEIRQPSNLYENLHKKVYANVKSIPCLRQYWRLLDPH